MKYLLFTIFFLYVADRTYIPYIIQNLLNKKAKPKNVKDTFVQEILSKKVGLKIPYVKLFPPAVRFYGVMPSNPPFKPVMFLSERVYAEFNRDEMEWLVLHEAGHYVLCHGAVGLIIHIVIIILGFIVLSFDYSFAWVVAIVLGIMGGLTFIQYTHLRERQANLFAVSRMENPLGMKTAAEKMMKRYRSNGINEKSLYARLFSIWNYYVREQQIKDSLKVIAKTK